MTENPRVEKLKVPTPEMNDLLVWLVRPIKELEMKFEAQGKEMKEIVKSCEKEAKDLKEFVGDMKAQFDKFSIIPNKQENRISALESKLKFYEDIVNDVKELKEQDVDKAKIIDSCKEDFVRQQNEMNGLREVQAGLKRQFNAHDHNFMEIDNRHKENVAKIEHMKACFDQDVHALDERLKDEMAERNRLADQVVDKHEMFAERLKLLNQHIDQFQAQLAQADKDISVQCMNAIESVKSNLVEDVMSRLLDLEKYKKGEEERFKDVRYDVELVEKRCEKLATMVKELKAERGV